MTFHLDQFKDPPPCGPRNCAACSGGLAVEYGGGGVMTAMQFRWESGISCTPGVHTASGGLRVQDVKRVAAAHGVNIDYGLPLSNWFRSELADRLRHGEGGILLGDAAKAPISPTTNFVYHSAWVHGLDSIGRTHWHDPRLSKPYWVAVDDVIRYWESAGTRYAGWVAPRVPDTSTPPQGDTDMALNKVDPTSGYCTTNTACQAVNVATGRPQPIGPNETYQAVMTAELSAPGIRYFVCASSESVEHAYLLAFAPADITFRTTPVSSNPPTAPADCSAAIAADRATARIVWG